MKQDRNSLALLGAEKETERHIEGNWLTRSRTYYPAYKYAAEAAITEGARRAFHFASIMRLTVRHEVFCLLYASTPTKHK